jgi:hypothetical protein
MAESTAGIGEAGALVNRAKAPATMDITRGIQMAENSALKKAQLEAAKAAKAQTAARNKAAAIEKASTVNTGKFKNLGVAKEAEKLANDLYTEFLLAYETGDYERESRGKIKSAYLGNYLASKDEAISTLKSPKKHDYAKKAGELINAGKEEEAAKYNKPYAPVFIKGEMGDYNVEVPDAEDLNKVYSSVLKNAFRDEISFASLKDAATDTENYTIKRRMTPAEVAMNTGNLLRDQKYVKSVLYDPDFQKFYDAKFGGSGDPASMEAGLYDYTQERINNINKDKVSVKSKGQGGGFTFVSGNEGNTKSYKFDRVNYVDGQDVVERLFVEKDGTPVIQFGDPRVGIAVDENMKEAAGEDYLPSKNPYVKTDAIKEQIKKSKRANVVQLDQSGQFDLTLTDKDRDDPSRKNTKPLYIIDADDNKYLVYAEGTPNDFSEHIMRFDSEGRLKNALLQYYSKDPSKDIQNVITGLGSNVFRASNKGGGSTPPPAPTVTAAKFKDMPVAERANFIKKGGKIKG